MTDAELEGARPLAGPADTDAVTIAWADPAERLYGLVRLGRSPAPGGEVAGSAIAVLFSGREPVAAGAHGGEPLPAGAGWDDLGVAGVAVETLAPLSRWRVAWAEQGGAGFSLELAALGPPARLGRREAAARAGGMEGYEQLCRVRGVVRDGRRERRVDGLGQRGHAWGAPDWERIALTRSVGAWLADGAGVTLTAVRPAGVPEHAGEAVWAALHKPGAEPLRVDDPRLSTTWDAEGRQRRAGLELWLDGDEEAGPERVAGEVLCGSTLDLGALRLDCAFFGWHAEGREGVGRYDVLRRA